jgi:type II secretory pathway pseudopilin PulG
MLVVTVMAAVVSALLLPRTRGFYSAELSSSARDRVQAYVAAARAVSVQTGRPSVFHGAHNAIWVTADSSGTQITYRASVRLDSTYQASMVATVDSIVFDARGLAQNLSTSQTINVTKDGITKSVCISALGAILRSGCG